MSDTDFYLLYNMGGLGQQPGELFKSASLTEVVRWGQEFQQKRWRQHGKRVEDWELSIRFGYGPTTLTFEQAKMQAALQVEQARQTLSRAMYSGGERKSEYEREHPRGSRDRSPPKMFSGRR